MHQSLMLHRLTAEKVKGRLNVNLELNRDEINEQRLSVGYQLSQPTDRKHAKDRRREVYEAKSRSDETQNVRGACASPTVQAAEVLAAKEFLKISS